MMFMDESEATIERNVLSVYEVLYPRAVEAVATALRPVFESGKLRGWIDGDGDRGRPPLWRLQRECERRFITTPARALAVIAYSPHTNAAEAWRWNWRDSSEAGLQYVGATRMALDVLHFAREKGWSKRQKGEDDCCTPRRSARRAA